jgi:hypothetical protein
MLSRLFRRYWPALAVLPMLVLLALALTARADEAPFAGMWKATFFNADEANTIALVRVAGTDDKPRLRLIDVRPDFKKYTFDSPSVDGKAIHFTFKSETQTFLCSFYPPRDEKDPKKLLGSVRIGVQAIPAQLEATKDREIDPRTADGDVAGFKELEKVDDAETAAEREKIIRSVLEKYAGQPVAYMAADILVRVKANAKGASEADLKAAAGQLLKLAEPYGPEMVLDASLGCARAFLRSGKSPALAIDYAKKAQAELKKSDPTSVQSLVLKTLVLALRKGDRADEARPYQEQIAKIEEELDREFEKNSIPFKPEKFGGRRSKSQRVAVVELFTGAQCPPCVAADIAFDAAMKTYNYNDVVFLQYHLHVPGPDALANEATDNRSDYYDVEGTPSMFIDGRMTESMAGKKEGGRESYVELRKLLDLAVEREPGATLKAAVQRKGDKIDVKVDVSGLKTPGAKVRLRLALIEDEAHYAGRNGQRLHRHVVRAFLGGMDGLPLREATATQNVTVDLGELRKTLSEGLTTFEKKHEFEFEEKPMALKDLKVIAFVQNDATKEILQAVQVKVPEV